MSEVKPARGVEFGVTIPVLIVGAGAGGLCAALAAKEAGAAPVVIERDAVPSGSTALSAGLIPAAGTRFQAAKGIADNPQTFAADIQRKAKNAADAEVVQAVTEAAGGLIEWLADSYGLPFDVVDNFNYPGHSAMRMHGLPSRSGAELIDRLCPCWRVAAPARVLFAARMRLPRTNVRMHISNDFDRIAPFSRRARILDSNL